MSELLEDHLQYLRAIRRRPLTIEARRNVLMAADRAFHPFGIDNADPDDWTWYFATLGKDWSGWTVSTYWNHVHGFYTWATSGQQPWLRYNPLADLPRPQVPRGAPNPVTEDELAYALDASDEWWQLVIMLGANAGFRVGDSAALEREDVDAQRIRIHDGKGGKSAEIPTHPDLWTRIAPVRRGHVVLGQRLHRPISAHRLTCMARKHFDAIGLPDVHLQRFRHFFATDLIRRGFDISIVRVLMRHESILITQRYIQIADEQRRLAISTLPVLSDRLAKRAA